jgi:hypothetical protein
VKTILDHSSETGIAQTLDSFLKKKKKPKKTAKSRKVKEKLELDKAVTFYRNNREQNWCNELSIPDDIIKQFGIFGVQTPEDAGELVDVLLDKGLAFMPKVGLLKVVD